MLNSKGFLYYKKFLEFGCFIGIFPYKWSKKQKRLLPMEKVPLLFHGYFGMYLFATVFFIVRFLMTHRKGLEYFPLFAKVFTVIWLLACVFSSICIYQVKMLRQVSMAFHNTLLLRCDTMLSGKDEVDDENFHEMEFVQDPGPETSTSKTEEVVQGMDLGILVRAQGKLRHNISAHVILQIVNFIVTVPSHSVGIFMSPCSPNFISSLILHCETAGSQVWFPLLIPFFVYELLIVLIAITVWMFCWFAIFLGLEWIYWELSEISLKPWVHSSVPQVIRTYKKLQVIMAQMNSSFQFYLGFSSSVMFALIGFAIYGSIRLVGIDWRSIMFVSCMTRCGFESVTPLIIAGNVNHKSKEIMRKMRQEGQPGDKGLRKAMKTITPLQTRAGIFYTYENSIVLTCMENLVLLVLNLLIMF